MIHLRAHLILMLIFLTGISSSRAIAFSVKDAEAKVKTAADSAELDMMIKHANRILDSIPEESRQMATWIIRKSRQLGIKSAESGAWFVTGRYYHKSGRYEQALNNYLIGLRLSEDIGDHRRAANICHNIGIIYLVFDDYSRSLNFELNAYAHLQKTVKPSHTLLAAVLSQIGLCYFEQGERKNALSYFQEALAQSRLSGDDLDMAIALHHITRVHLFNKDYSEAIKTGLESYKHASNYNDSGSMSFALASVAQAYLGKGDQQMAGKFINETEKLTINSDDKILRMSLFTMYTQYYKKAGNYEKALAYYELLKQETDSFNTEKTNRRMAELDLNYQVSKKNARLLLLQKENELKEVSLKSENKTKNAFIIVSVLTVIGGSVIFYFLIQKNRINKKLDLLNREKSTVMGILSHDLRAPFTRIHTLARVIEQNDTERKHDKAVGRIRENVNDGIHLLQNLLDITFMEDHNNDLLLNEIDILDFMQNIIEDHKNNSRTKQIALNLHVDISQLDMVTDIGKFKRIIDNLLSNAVKYSKTGTEINVVISESDDFYIISISDQGVGIRQSEMKKLFKKFSTAGNTPTNGESSTGMGLYIVKTLCTQLGGFISVTSKEHEGSTFTVHLKKLSPQATLLSPSFT